MVKNKVISNVARRTAFGEGFGMATITIQVEDDLARRMEESARHAHQSLSDWVQERIKSATNQVAGAVEPVADQTHLSLDDFPRFATSKPQQERLSRDVIYDERGR